MIALKLKNLFFENRSLKQTIFKNLSWFSLSEFVTRILSFSLVIFIARILGAEDYGLLTFAISLSAIITVLTGFCSDFIIIRELNLKEESKNELGAVLGLRFILGLLAFFLTILSSFFVESEAQLLVVVFAFVVLLDTVTTYFRAIFKAIQRVEYVAFIEIFKTVTLVFVGFLVLFSFPNINYIAYAYLLGNIVAFIVSFLKIKRVIRLPKITLDWKIYKKYFYYSLPLAFGTFLYLIYMQIDSVMMGFWGMMEEVGWYRASYKIVDFFALFAVIKVVIFPAVTKAFRGTSDYFQRVIDKFFEFVMFITFPVIAGGFLLSQEIILFLYGQEFLPSVLVFKILIPITGLSLFATLVQSVLITKGKQKYVFYLTGSTALLNVILNLILIPKYSLYGAGIATLLSYILLFFLSVVALKRVKVRFNPKSALFPFFSVLIMIFILFLTSEFHFLFRVIFGMVIYLVVFYLFSKLKNKNITLKNSFFGNDN